MEAERALRYACASGAMAVTAMGPMEGTATLAELDAFIAKTSEHNHA
jgi:sugar/nucleoside kinase (ribokinase family)